ncbi:MAG: hypothetical protein V3T83_21510, partial [Acidobacteriota bacterium]
GFRGRMTPGSIDNNVLSSCSTSPDGSESADAGEAQEQPQGRMEVPTSLSSAVCAECIRARDRGFPGRLHSTPNWRRQPVKGSAFEKDDLMPANESGNHLVLARAILAQAFWDALAPPSQRTPSRVKSGAVRWFASLERTPGTFQWICSILQIEPVPLGQWVSRAQKRNDKDEARRLRYLLRPNSHDEELSLRCNPAAKRAAARKGATP